MQLPDSFSRDHSPQLQRGQTFKTALRNLSFSREIVGQASFCLLPLKPTVSKRQNSRTTFFVWSFISKTVKLSIETVAARFHKQQIPSLFTFELTLHQSRFNQSQRCQERAAAVSPDNWKSEDPSLMRCFFL